MHITSPMNLSTDNMLFPDSDMPGKTRRKTRRGKKKYRSHKDLVPSPNVSPTSTPNRADYLKTEKQKDRLLLCGCGLDNCSNENSPNKSTERFQFSTNSDSDTSRSSPTTSPLKMNHRKRYLRPCAPKAPHNSTQFIMKSHLEDLDLSLYIDTYDKVSHNENNLDSSELNMESFVLNDFETVFEASEKEFQDGTHNSKSSPYYSPTSNSDSDKDNGGSPNNPDNHVHLESPSSEQFNSWSNQSIVEKTNSSTSYGRRSTNYKSPTDTFFSFMSQEFEKELKKSREEILNENNISDLRESFLRLKKYADKLITIDCMKSELNSLRRENEILKQQLP